MDNINNYNKAFKETFSIKDDSLKNNLEYNSIDGLPYERSSNKD